MKKTDFLEYMQELAPAELAEPWDNCGLLVDTGAEEYTRVMIALDATHEAIAEAKDWGAQLLITHHPLMLHGIKRIDGSTYDGQAVRSLLQGGISHFAAHTNLDAAKRGVNDALFGALGLVDRVSLGGVDNPLVGAADGGTGLGFAGDLPRGMTLLELSQVVKAALNCEHVRLAGEPAAAVRRVAVSSGAGFSLLRAAKAAGAEAFITGEARHHELLEARSQGMAVIEAGHHESEHIVLGRLIEGLQQRFNKVEYRVEFKVSGALPPTVII